MFQNLFRFAEESSTRLSRRRLFGKLGDLALGTFCIFGLAGVAQGRPRGCRTNGDCGQGQYCQKKNRACASRGACAPRPEFCTEVYEPVCGCDGATYPNPCYAARAGVNVAYPGPCRRRR